MTLGEQAIWAAAYAVARRKMLDWKRAHGGEEYHQGAIEDAAYAVINAREHRQEMVDGWGEDSDVVKLLDEML